MKWGVPMSLLVFVFTGSMAGGEIVESIPNHQGGWATLYDENTQRCKGDNYLAMATDGMGQVVGLGCWQHYSDGYLIFVAEGDGAGDIIHISYAMIEELKQAHDKENSRDHT